MGVTVSIFADAFRAALELRAKGAQLPHETEAAYGDDGPDARPAD